MLNFVAIRKVINTFPGTSVVVAAIEIWNCLVVEVVSLEIWNGLIVELVVTGLMENLTLLLLALPRYLEEFWSKIV